MPRFRLSEEMYSQPSNHEEVRHDERGFLLAGSAVLILIIIALIGSFAFVLTRTNHFQGNYATGERLARLAVLAHNFAQDQHYGAAAMDLDSAGELYGGAYLNPPDNFAFHDVADTVFSVEIRGRNLSPVNASTPAAIKAASAYIHLRVRPTNGKGRPPSDDVALQAGANHAGMSRMGFYKIGFVASDLCDGGVTAVRWGGEDDACLNDSQVGAMFTDVQRGDIIVPVWETALSQMTKGAMTRYPQPQRPDISTMNTNLNMGTNNIVNATNATSDNVVANPPLSVPPKPPSTFGTMQVRSGSPTKFTDTLNRPQANNGLHVYDENNGPFPMNVAGPVTLAAGGAADLNISDNLTTGGSGNLDIVAGNQVNVQTLGQTSDDMQVQSISGNKLMAGIRNIAQPLAGLNVTAPDGVLAVAGDLTTQHLDAKTGQSLGIYAANMTTTNGAQIRNAADNLDWNVKSINQKGNDATHGLMIDKMIAGDCNGPACPNAIHGTGGTGF